jgi:hypothetical protein
VVVLILSKYSSELHKAFEKEKIIHKVPKNVKIQFHPEAKIKKLGAKPSASVKSGS